MMHCPTRVLAIALVACAVTSACNRTPVPVLPPEERIVVERQPPANDAPPIQEQSEKSEPQNHPEFEKLDSGSNGPRDYSEVVETAEAAVIRLNVKIKEGEVTGSGFVVSADGVAFTNFHVVDGAESAVATFRNGATAAVEGTLHLDSQRDIAVIRLKAPGKLDFIQLAPSLPKKGQPVVALGAPRGLSFSVTEGIVSAVRSSEELKELGLDVSGTWIQTSAPISGGNSGGPLVNLQGFVVGANTMTLRTGQNLNFAISTDDLRGALEKSRESKLAALGSIKSTRPRVSMRATETDQPEPESAESIAKRKEFLEQVTKWNEDRRKRLDELRESIATEKPALKSAMLAGDAEREEQVRSKIDDLRQEIATLAKSLPKFPKLNLMNLSANDFGFLGGTSVDVLQVIDKAQGRLLINAGSRSSRSPILVMGPTIVLISGLDLSSVADRARITLPDRLAFQVLGTRTYSTIRGGTNTIFEVVAVPESKELLVPLEGLAKGDSEPELTDAERATVAEKKQVQADADAAAKRNTAAKSKLKLAKDFLKSGKNESARKWLQTIVQDFEDTDSVPEAKKLLKTLPEQRPAG